MLDFKRDIDSSDMTSGPDAAQAGAQPLLMDMAQTPLGPMILAADDSHLYLCEFTDRKNIDQQVSRVKKGHGRAIAPGRTEVTEAAKAQLADYFDGRLTAFDLPIKTTGTEFQNRVWDALQRISYGQTRSYSQLADMAGNPRAVRAAASSNARNGLTLIIPCHRVIASDGGLGGFAGGLERKSWLLEHEARTGAV